jgi:hypothetical protein
MSVEKRYHVLDCYVKKWHPSLSNNENAENSNPFIESRKRIGANGDKWTIFLRDSESRPSSQAEEVLEFIQNFGSDTKWEEGRQDASLDDRSCRIKGNEVVRISKKSLSPAELEEHLSVPVCTQGFQQRK